MKKMKNNIKTNHLAAQIGFALFVGFVTPHTYAQTVFGMSFINPLKICEEKKLSSHCHQFLMGSPETELGRFPDETPHLVTLTHPFEIQTTLVTREEYLRIAERNSPALNYAEACPIDEINLNDPISCPHHPVENLSWNEVDAFIKKLNEKLKSDILTKNNCTYRLPTEAEWEYSARGGTTTAYFFGNDPRELNTRAWYLQNSNNHSHEVRSMPANGFGLYDMHGNVWEWVSDFYGDYDLINTTDPQGPSKGKKRVFRGGAYDSDALQDLRSASRGAGAPNGKLNSKVNQRMGFRLVRTCDDPI